MSVNEALFLGVSRSSNELPTPEKKISKVSKKASAANETFDVLSPAADKLIEILRFELKKEDSIVQIRARVRADVEHPTSEDYAIEMHASEIVAKKIEKIINVLEMSKRSRLRNE